jgi:hypothetical protein
MPNQALEQTRDSVLRHGEAVGCELLNFFVLARRREAEAALSPTRGFRIVRASRGVPVTCSGANRLPSSVLSSACDRRSLVSCHA